MSNTTFKLPVNLNNEWEHKTFKKLEEGFYAHFQDFVDAIEGPFESVEQLLSYYKNEDYGDAALIGIYPRNSYVLARICEERSPHLVKPNL